MDIRGLNSQASNTQFIKNPLPVPKRHERKEMDFDLEVPEQNMHYDVPEKDYDDFDIP